MHLNKSVYEDHPSHLDQKTKKYVRKMAALVGPQEPLLLIVKRRKLARFGHVTMYESLCKTAKVCAPGNARN
ncbi:hypothetical protein DPMN_023778 [Dreissena polymorpha]|uniref:Uncharacterized protein n=1 Tax=Dreissena polymorpha TaxID=45954 RepID=A0A9D4LLC1_DREPO|nr:hypothetical protein DPMN_023778 [Dreissena polymorpha]